MQTKTYESLVERIEALAGVDFQTNETPRIKSLINRRAKQAYRASLFWPRFLVVGEERTVSNRLIPFEEAGKDNIDTFIQIHKTQPFNRNSVVEFNFYVTNSGATVIDLSTSETSVFVTYQKQLTDTYGDSGGEESDVPDEWFEYIAYGAYADFLRMDEQQSKAMAEEAFANQELMLELRRIDAQHTTNFIGRRIATHSQSQGRNY